MSTWGKKLESKLSALADSASNESIQTLANWIGFNRKHAPAIAQTLADALKAQADSPTRQWVYWQVVHEILLLENSNPTKWDRLQDLRTAVGETTIVAAIKGLPDVSPQVGDTLIKEWDELNVFGGPTLVSQIRRLLASPATSRSAEETPKDTKSTTSPSEQEESSEKTQTAKEASVDQSEVMASKSTAETTTTTSSSATAAKKDDKDNVDKVPIPAKRPSLKEVNYDFESKNVPAGKVDSREFLEPCKAIATLQIARDLRNDAPVQLSSLLNNLPKDIQNSIDNDQELDEKMIEDFSRRIPAKLLDLDMEEQMANIATFQDIVKRQQAARKTLIHLLLKSRCQFGSKQAAKEFFELPQVSQKLSKRKQLLTDALELEGIETEDIDTSENAPSLSALPELSWYQEGEGNNDKNPSPAKKARIEGES